MKLDEHLRGYVGGRADGVSENDADVLVTRALARPAPPDRWPRHGRNAAAAVALSLVLIAGGIVLETQLLGHHSATVPSAGPLPAVPNEIVNLDNVSQGADVVTPFRLKDQKVLDPRPRWVVAPGTGLMITSGGLCDLTVIHVVDLGSPPHDTRQPVSLPGCFLDPSLVPNSTVVLLDHQVRTQQSAQDLGLVAYDWSAGRVVRSYPGVPPTFGGGLVSSDGTRLYTLNPHSVGELDITDLTTGGVNQVPVQIEQVGLNAGGMALSPDGRTLYLNQGTSLRTFSARTGKAGLVLNFKDPRAGPTAVLPGWLTALLPSINVTAKEGFEPGHGIAVDPKGRWIAALGIDAPGIQGIWVFDTAGSIRLLRHVDLRVAWRGIAASLDGSVLYGLDSQGSIDIFDPHTGQMRQIVNARFPDLFGIAGIEPNSP
jgi:hypothetical protein